MAIQTESAVTTIRPSVASSAAEPIRYIPEVHGFHGAQDYFPELKRSDMTFATIVADIASAQHEDIRRIIAVDLANGKCWDASVEVAKAVLDTHIREDGEVPRWSRAFLEDILGVAHVNSAELWDAA
jgi:hypothetical protein